jgi:hypothetical protein
MLMKGKLQVNRGVLEGSIRRESHYDGCESEKMEYVKAVNESFS